MSDKTFTQDEVNHIVQDRLERDRNTRVTHDPRVYALHSPHSWYMDVIARATRGSGPATERLTRYAKELGREMAHGTPEGQRCERILRSVERSARPEEHERRFLKLVNELRAFGTAGGITASASGGEAAAFVSPAFLVDQYAPFRGAARSFADQCHRLPLPAYGMKVYIPYFSSAPTVTEQTEGGSVSGTDPATALEVATVETITGQIVPSQQVLDRGASGGGTLDAILHGQIQQQLDERIDKYTLGQAINNGKAVSGASEFKIEKFYEDLAKGREEITDTAGTRLRPTHFFSTSDFYSWVTRQVDTTNKRPLVVPLFAPGFPISSGADDYDSQSGKLPPWSRFTGSVLPGGVLWFTDDNIPNLGTTSETQLIVSAPGTAVVLMEDEPILTVFEETKANTLQVILNLRSYVAAITRHASGTAAIAGAGYTTSLV